MAEDDSDLKFDEKTRSFEGWATVNVVDKAGELVPVKRVEALMPIYMERGGIIVDTHSGRHCGKVDKWELKHNDKADADGIYIWAHVFDHYKLDNVIWRLVKSHHYKGLSIGGQDFGKVPECNDEVCYTKIKDLEMWEISLVESPMNKQAWLTRHNPMAKVDEERSNKRYGIYVENGKDAAGKVGWSSRIEQFKRFDVLGNVFEGEKSPNLLDVGAGLGAFKDWMVEKGLKADGYHGIDIMPEFKQDLVEIREIRKEDRKFDYVVASGVWNWTKMDAPKDPEEEFKGDLSHLFALSNKGLAFNILVRPPHPEYVAIDYEKVVNTVKGLANRFSVRDFNENEVTVAMWKDSPIAKTDTTVSLSGTMTTNESLNITYSNSTAFAKASGTSTIAPLATVGTPMAECDKKKADIGEQMEGADKCKQEKPVVENPIEKEKEVEDGKKRYTYYGGKLVDNKTGKELQPSDLTKNDIFEKIHKIEACDKLQELEKSEKIKILIDRILNSNPLEDTMAEPIKEEIKKEDVKKDDMAAVPAGMTPADPLAEIRSMLMKIDSRLGNLEAGGVQKTTNPCMQQPEQVERQPDAQGERPDIHKAEPVKDVKLPMSQEKQEEKTIGPNKVSGGQYLSKEDAAKLIADTVAATVQKMGYTETPKPKSDSGPILEQPLEKTEIPKEEAFDFRKLATMRYDEIHEKAQNMMGGVRY